MATHKKIEQNRPGRPEYKPRNPTKYEQRFDDMLIDHMAKGFSYESFAGLVNVAIDTLYNWERLSASFLDAKKTGLQKCRLFWEQEGVSGLKDRYAKDKDGKTIKIALNSPVWIYNMKCRFRKEWTEQKDLNVTQTEVASDETVNLLKDIINELKSKN